MSEKLTAAEASGLSGRGASDRDQIGPRVKVIDDLIRAAAARGLTSIDHVFFGSFSCTKRQQRLIIEHYVAAGFTYHEANEEISWPMGQHTN